MPDRTDLERNPVSDTKEVFRLRKSGESPKALQMARVLFRNDPTDEWVIRAYGWSLHDCIKMAVNSGSSAEQIELTAEMKKLNISEQDEPLFKARERWIRDLPGSDGAPGLTALAAQCTTARKEGDLQQARVLGQQAIERYPGEGRASLAMGWVIWEQLKAELQQDKIARQRVRDLFLEYAALPCIQKPDLLHSLMLRHAIRTVRENAFPTFVAYFRWWEPDSFRDEDLVPDEPFQGASGKTVRPDSLRIKAMSALKASIHDETPEADIEWVSELIGQAVEDYPDHPWLPYWHGSLLARVGEPEQAREKILPIVRTKRNEAWAWRTLANTYPDSEADLRLACLCRAAQCRVQDEGYLTGVFQDLAMELERREMLPEAKWLLERIRAIRSERGWKENAQVEKLQSEPYSTVEAANDKDGRAVIAHHAPGADEILVANLPVTEGLLLRKLPANSRGDTPLLLGLMLDEKLETSVVYPDRHEVLRDAQMGTPLHLRFDQQSQQLTVVEVTKRDASSWDGLDPTIGVVEHINSNKHVSAVLTGGKKACLVHHDRFPDASSAAIGSFVKIRSIEDSRRDVSHALTFESTEERPDESYYRDFTGTLDLIPDAGFGFIRTEDGESAHVSRDWVRRMELEDDETLEGAIVRKWLKDKRTFGWNVVELRRIRHE